MQIKIEYAHIRAVFARKKLIDGSITPDSKLRMNGVENGPDFAHHGRTARVLDIVELCLKIEGREAGILLIRCRNVLANTTERCKLYAIVHKICSYQWRSLM